MAKSKVDKWLEKENLILLEGWARDGLTDEQIAHNMGIARSTLIEWKRKYSVISVTLKKGKEVVDFEVENALLKKATGYVQQIKKIKTNEYGDEYITTESVWIPPDTTAQIFWLKNRKPKQWRERVEIDASEEQLSKVEELLSKIKGIANE